MNAEGRDVSAIMRKVRSRDTTPEVLFRKTLWARGLRYRICRAPLAGKPDVALSRARLAIFIDGDFWHGGQWRKRRLAALEDQFTKTPTRDYWLGKIRRNMQRDCVATASLMDAGWKVLRFWESQVYRELDRCAGLALAAARGELPVDPLSVLPAKRFVNLGPGAIGQGLKEEGWLEADAEHAACLAVASFPDAPAPELWAALAPAKERARLVLLQARRAKDACAELARLGYSARNVAGTRLVVAQSCDEVAEPGLPKPPADTDVAKWIARYYLNPLVSDLMRGRLLGKSV